ncbi:hypothetical protein KFE25_001603 [Diacronema lutheri]|uniref:Uncharacterized protein n=1 Tax=Diacronema lutheri TaxID=2081491 RepID=A0A8J6CAP4_DIALT|nr:hypothetical protein KFE25_001603 [Diacronema lutheri]
MARFGLGALVACALAASASASASALATRGGALSSSAFGRTHAPPFAGDAGAIPGAPDFVRGASAALAVLAVPLALALLARGQHAVGRVAAAEDALAPRALARSACSCRCCKGRCHGCSCCAAATVAASGHQHCAC